MFGFWRYVRECVYRSGTGGVIPIPLVLRATIPQAYTARLLRIVVLCVVWSQAVLFARGQATAPISVVGFPATTAVGQQTQLAIPISITQAGSSATPLVVTQGIAGLDFQIAPGGTCASGVSYTVGQQCTVNAVFGPKYPGLRSGAVVLQSTGGAVLGLTFLTGTATGGLSVLAPGRIDTVAGNGAWIYTVDGGLATQTPIFLPTGIVTDAAGNLYLSDSNNNRIRCVNAQGVISTVAGTGSPGYSGDGGVATLAAINAPAGIVLDGAGDLYFADTGNHAIRRIDATTHVITTVAGTPTVQGYSGEGTPATAATLSLPEGLAFDAAQNLYIADTGNNVVRVVSASNGFISTVAGTGTAGYSGDGHAATSARLDSPWSVAIGNDGSIYIADLTNNVVRKVSAGIISTIAGNGTAGFSGDGQAPTSAQLNAPASVVFDPAGNMYIADSGNNRVREIFASSQTIQTITGTDSEQFAGDTGPANLASLYGPYALFLDQAGDLFIADMFHNRVRSISASAIALSYDTIRVGKLSAPQLEGLINDGNASLTLAAATLNSSALDPATTTCNAGDILPIDGPCELGVDFAPTTTGNPVLGTLTVNSDAGNPSPVISLSGQVLSVNPTAVSLISSANPSLVGAPVTFTATVSSAASSLTGTMVFLDGATQICSVALAANGSATCATSSLALGQHSMTASYSGDADDAAGVSSTLPQVVQQAAGVALAAAPNPAAVTHTVTLTATATAPTGTPTGTVTFYDGTAAIGSANLNPGGIATFSTNQLTAATHNLSVQYTGDATDAATQSNAVSEVVNLATTLTTLSSSNATVTVGTSVTLSASVTSTNGPVPTGTVQFTAGSTLLGTGTLDGTGNTSLLLSSLAPGTYKILATYSSDADNATSVSTPLSETIQQIPTTTAVVSDTNPASAGATIHLTATVAMTSGNTADGAITGTVAFTDGSAMLGTMPINSAGQATLTLDALSAGAHSIVASYSDNANYTASTSAALSEQIQNTATTTVVSTPSASILAGEPITFTITVGSSTGIPTGSITIRNGAANIGQAQLNAQGTTTFTASSLPVGSNTLTAVYQGDSNYLTSTSASWQETVSLATTALTLAGPSAPVNAGTTFTVAATLTTDGVAPTGALTLRDGGAVIATQTVSTAGSFAFSTASLSLGTHTLTAAYAGDSDNAATVSPSIIITVQQGPTTTSLTTSASPSTLGQSLTLTAGVTSPSPGITGSVTFQDGTTVLGSVPLVNGAASFTTSSLVFGPHSLTAVYSSDTDHAASTSSAIAEQIVEPATAALVSSNNPSVSGANVVFAARITGVGTIIPTGGVIFKDGATILATVALDATGAASFLSTSLTVGSHTISVSYAGDTHDSATSASLIQTVQNASTQIALTASANPAIYAAPLSITATIASDGGTATGPVIFTDNGTSIGSAVLNANGVATLTLSTLAPGAHTIVANYAGDGKASASVSTPLLLTVKQLTSIAVASSANPSPTLSAVVLTATITNSGVSQPTGSITFTDGGTQLGTAVLNANGQASLSIPSLAAGNHTVVASYAGDPTNFASVSSSLIEGVQLRPTTTALTASQTNASNPLQVTLIALVRWSGPATPTGTVSFSSPGGTIGSIPVDATGVATITIDLESATENITATYNGDGAYAASSSLSTIISGGVATQFTLSINLPIASVQTSQHIVVTLTATSLSGFADTLQLGCLGLPFAATCTFSNPQMPLAANGTSTVQLTIDTANPIGEGSQASNRRSHPPNVMLCMLPGTLLAGLLFFRKRRLPILPLLLLLCAFTATVSLTGCGGLQGSSTPPGSYAFKISAAGAHTGFTETQVMNLTVTP
jgi:hypothetical protein